MIEAILSSGIAGFIGAPILSLIKGYEERKQKKIDIEKTKLEMAHELKMMEVQINNTKILQEMRLAEVEISSNAQINNNLALVDIERQKNLYTGNSKMDSFISSVRPVVTYLFTIIFLMIFGLYGYVTISLSDTTMEGLDKFLESNFTQGMSYLFANIITFWFGQRLLDKVKK